MFGYISLALALLGLTGKQFAMKKCGQKTPGAFNSICINMMRVLICVVVSLIIWLISGGGITNGTGHFIIFLSGLGTALNLFAWILCANLVSLVLIESLSMIGAMVIPMILAPYIYAGDEVSWIQWVGCVLVFISAFLFSNKTNKKGGFSVYKILIVFICVLGTTLATVFKKYYIVHFVEKGLGTVEYFTLISFVVALLTFIIAFSISFYMEKKRINKNIEFETKLINPELPYKKVWFFIIMASAFLYVNELFIVYAAELPSAVYFPLSRGLSIVCTFLLDIVAFKEKVSIKKVVGIVVVIAAIILINI